MNEASPTPSNVRDAFSLLCSVATPYVWRRLAASLSLVVLTSIIAALTPVVLKEIIDSLHGNAQSLHGSPLALIGLYAASQWMTRTLTEIRSYIHSQADRRLARAFSTRMFSHVMRLPLRYYLNGQTGVFNETLSNGVTGMQMVLQTIESTVVSLFVQVTTVALVLVSLDQPLLIIALGSAMACYAVTFSRGTVGISRSARFASSSQIEVSAIATDSLLNFETVKYFGAESLATERLDRSLVRTETAWAAFFRTKMFTGFTIGTIFACFLAITSLYAGGEILDGRMTVGTFVLINAYIFQMVAPMEHLGFASQQLSQGFAFLERMLDLFRQEPEIGDQGSCRASEVASSTRSASRVPPRPMSLTFEHVGASYGKERSVLRDISFRLPQGRTVGIVGASGSGKSTIVRILVRFIEPEAGRVLIDEQPIVEIPLDELRRAIAVVPQDTALFNESIAYNIGVARPGSSQADIEEAARISQLHDFVMQLPSRYETYVGERGVRLSGGERQRVSIARAALRQPRIYVFDEATSSLDSRTERDILENLMNLSRRATTLIIAHRLSTVVHADEILVVEKGATVERGTHSQLLHQGGRYAALWSAQQHQSRVRM